jgi:hypothetical protein
VNVAHAKQTAREWVEAHIDQWPGLRAAHLVGGITTMPADAPFPPAENDVDVHLIFDAGSPALRSHGPFTNLLEVAYRGIAIEAGIKPVSEYVAPAAVLANPEIAPHLLVDSLLYDPDDLLRDLQAPVRREYRRRRGVRARLDHERRGLAGALARRPMVAANWGARGEVNILGYTCTFATAALCVATLTPLRMGSRTLLNLCENLAAYDRLDLYEALLTILGVQHTPPARVERLLEEGAEAFDLALDVMKPTASPRPFQHKAQRHLRLYFAASCRRMLAEGYHREALAWLVPYYMSATDIIVADGSDAQKATFAARCDAFLRELGMDRAEVRAEKFEQAARLYECIFALADEIVAHHPAVID